MIKISFVILSFVLSLSLTNLLVAKPTLCHEAKDQNSQNQCISNQYSASQKTLDGLILKVTKDYFTNAEIFNKHHQSWIQFRKDHCESQAQEWGSGSMAPFIHMSCMDRLTQAKIQEIEAILQYSKTIGE